MSLFKKMANIVSAPHGSLDLKLQTDVLYLGQTLKGDLLFVAKENFASNMVRCEIECIQLFYHTQMVENSQQMVTDATVLYSARLQLQGQMSYKKGETIKLPFTILIPNDSAPSLERDFVNISWTVKGVIAVSGRPDITTQKIPFQVIG
jgi:sporulation-control protein spo0M